MLPIGTILCPTDFSEQSRPAFEIARALARDYGAKLLLFHVIPVSMIPAPEGFPIEIPEEDQRAAYDKLHALAAQSTGVNIESRALLGEPAEEILAFAKSHAVDLIVMGTHGYSGLSRLLMGSVAESVQRRAPCPVLTARSKATDTQDHTLDNDDGKWRNAEMRGFNSDGSLLQTQTV